MKCRSNGSRTKAAAGAGVRPMGAPVRSLALAIAMGACVGAHGAPPRTPAAGEGVVRVLFVGNSYSVAAPKVLERLCTSAGRRLAMEAVTPGGWRLSAHLNQGTAAKFTNRWNFIVLQDQSQAPSFPEDQVARTCVPAARDLAEAARKAGAVPLLFLTWGRRDGDQVNTEVFPNDTYEAMQDRLDRGYRMMSESSGAAVVPVGKAWRIARKRHPAIDLYVTDGSHPSAAGAYLAACVFYGWLFKADPTTLKTDEGLPKETAAALRAAARDALSTEKGRAAP